MTSSHKPVKVMSTLSNLTIGIMKMAGHHNIAAVGRHDARDATRTLATPGLSPACPKRTLRHYAGALQHRALRTGPVEARTVLAGHPGSDLLHVSSGQKWAVTFYSRGSWSWRSAGLAKCAITLRQYRCQRRSRQPQL